MNFKRFDVRRQEQTLRQCSRFLYPFRRIRVRQPRAHRAISVEALFDSVFLILKLSYEFSREIYSFYKQLQIHSV